MLQLRRADQADGDQAGTAELDFVAWAKGTAQVVLGRARTVHQCRGGRPVVGVAGIADLAGCVRTQRQQMVCSRSLCICSDERSSAAVRQMERCALLRAAPLEPDRDGGDWKAPCAASTPKRWPAGAEFWHLWTVIIPRLSITGQRVRGRVWRRHDGRRWEYRKITEYDQDDLE